MKEITIEHAKFKERKDKMIKVLANLEYIREGGKDIHITLQMMNLQLEKCTAQMSQRFLNSHIMKK